MATTYNTLESKLEDALKSIVSALGIVGVTFATGASADTLEAPCVVCSCQEAPDEVVKDTGIFQLRGRVIVRTSPDESPNPLQLHKNRVGAVRDAIITDSIAADLAAAVTDFYVYDVTFAGLSQEPIERTWSTVLNLDVICCGSDIAEA